MAYHHSGFSDGEIGEYHWAPYSNASYDVVPYQASITCSDFDSYEPKSIEYYPATYEFDEPKFLDYHPATYRDTYDSYYSHSDVNYCAYKFTEPMLITYEPIPCDSGYVLSETQYLISYSTANSGFGEPEFEEYDPTPYDGGYDLSLTYGKPLPPSDEICYPRSAPQPNSVPSENISHENTPSAREEKSDAVDSNTPRDEKEKVDAGDSGIPLIESIDGGEKENKDMSIIEEESDSGSDVDETPELKLDEENGEGEYTCSDYGYDYPWSGYGYDSGNIGKQVNEYTPYEYNADTVDLCESIFGHWPCLARRKERSNRNEDAAIADGKRDSNPWEGTANFLFGDPLEYGDSNFHSENYHRQQPCVMDSKVECCDENSWIHNLNIFENVNLP